MRLFSEASKSAPSNDSPFSLGVLGSSLGNPGGGFFGLFSKDNLHY